MNLHIKLFRRGIMAEFSGQRNRVVHPLGIIGLLNQLGQDEWELVDVEGQVYYLKRSKRSATS
jgi:hypothetical protein